MNRFRNYAFIVFQFALCSSNGQAINNAASYRDITGDNYFRLNYDNDFFTATDWYYSQGINLEYVRPLLKNLALEKFLLHSEESHLRYGVLFEHDAYTPTSIRHEDILYDDHPFAATLSLRLFIIADDSAKQKRISSSATVGAIGPRAGGEWMQKSIHKWLHNIEPLGWKNQIQNDFILNYEISYEKKLFSNNYLLLNGYGKMNVGTLFDNAGAGITLMIGSFNSAFDHAEIASASKKKFHFHFYSQPVINLAGYDATLQGGLFNRNNPYTISANDITRITFQNNFGLVINIRNLYLEYYQSFLTKEFSQGESHRWGGIKIGIEF